MAMTVKESAQVRGAKRQARRDFRAGMVAASIVVLLVIALIVGVAVDAAVLFSVIEWIKSPIPGEGSLWSTALLALTGTVVILGFHVHTKHNPDGPLFRSVEIMTAILIVLYGVGAGGALAAGLWFGGAELLFDPDAGATLSARLGAFLEHAAEQAPPGVVKTALEETIFPFLSLAFVIGVGGLPVCVLYIAHRLLEAIVAKGPAIEQLCEACERLRIIAQLERNQQIDAALGKRQTVLRNALAAAPQETAKLVLMRIAQAIRIRENKVEEARRSLASGAARVPREIEGQEFDEFDVAEGERTIKRLRAYSVADALEAIKTH